jgi:lysophospholipase L1-like esterase
MPDANDRLLASQNWFERYWTPINSLGYRDQEWTTEALEGKTQIVVLGDSFAAGHGIQSIDDRFSGVLASDLGDEYAVMTVAKLGWPTSTEAQALADAPYTPDWVVLSYYINDIEELADDFQTSTDASVKGTYRAPALVKQSYLLNYVYFRGLRLPMFEQSNATTYVDFLEELYTGPDAWTDHATDLLSIAGWCDAHDARLLVVIFPNLIDPASTHFATERVAGLFAEHGIPTLEVEMLIEGWEPEDRVVNRFDAHPSEKLSATVGHALTERIRELEAEH